MKPLLVLILSLSFSLTALGQQPEYPDSGFVNKAEAKNLYKDSLKEGKWVEYYKYQDSTFILKLTDDTNALYYTLSVYKNGKAFGLVREYNKKGKFLSIIRYKKGEKNGIEIVYRVNGTILKEIPYNNGALNGIMKEYYENGKIRMEMPFINDTEKGVEKHYYETGTLNIEETIYNGTTDGVEKVYYEDGKIWFEHPFVKGIKNGIDKEYYDGIEPRELKKEKLYINDTLNGTERYYNSNGTLYEETPYRGGNINGIVKTYYDNGKLESETTYEDGVAVARKTYEENGTLNTLGQQPEYPDSGFTNKAEAKNLTISGKREGKWFEYVTAWYSVITDTNTEKYSYYQLCVYKGDKLNGVVRRYDKEGGILVSEDIYRSDKLNGLVKYYYKNGKVQYETSFIDGKENGLEKHYYENGVLKYEASYIDGKENGLEKQYYENGELQFQTLYKNGKAQDSLSNMDYAFYDYLIMYVKTYYKLDSTEKDTVLSRYNMGGYIIKIRDSTEIDRSHISDKDTDSIYTIDNWLDYDKLNKTKYLVEKNRLNTDKLVKKIKDKKPLTPTLEFGKPYFFNHNMNAIVYMGVTMGPLDGEGCLYIFQRIGDKWKVLKKIMIWVS